MGGRRYTRDMLAILIINGKEVFRCLPLARFWSVHDPTTLNRQGPDVGTQYRSAVFTHSAEQAAVARAAKEMLQASAAKAGRSIVTEIVPAGTFYAAEAYHQEYYAKRGGGSCHLR